MCRNANKPCPGCKNHASTDAPWMFFSKDERQVLEQSGSETPTADEQS